VLAHLDGQTLAFFLALGAQAAHAEGHDDEAHVQPDRGQQHENPDGGAQPAGHAALIVVGAECGVDGHAHVRQRTCARNLALLRSLLDERVASGRARFSARLAVRFLRSGRGSHRKWRRLG
jgi:hypothetical protein